ncbi:MAG: 50S ribosomal protein L6 [Bacteroidales bacterium]|jgi:large subunit ribosomal protein L6|nr:50S ribosomal protein L6 [Bacteroidales bacterium]
MSRIGKLPIVLPEGVTINIDEKKSVVTVKGKRGELFQAIDPAITLKVEGNTLYVNRHTEQKRHKALHGLYRSLLANMVKGVSEGFTVVQELVGTGYKVQATGQILDMSLGYSHNIVFELPKEITVETVTEKGKNPLIKMTCSDKQLLGQVASKIRSYRKPEPYKGKGIRFQNEVVRKKAGKSADK